MRRELQAAASSVLWKMFTFRYIKSASSACDDTISRFGSFCFC